MSTATLSAPEWLTQFCSTESHRPALLAPMAFALASGERITVATDGARLYALDADCGYPDADEKLRAGMAKVLNVSVPGVPLALDAFRAFLVANVPERTQCTDCNGTGELTCDECDGDGTFECECLECGDGHPRICKVCKGTGDAPCETCKQGKLDKVIVRIGGNVFDARLFARPLEALTGESATLHAVPQSMHTAAMIRGDGWRLIVMPLREGKPIATFEMHPERASVPAVD